MAIIQIIIVWFNIHHSLCIPTTTLWLSDWWWPRPPSDQLSVLYAYCMSHTTASHADRLCFALHLSPFICQRSQSHILLLCSAISGPTYCLWVQNGNLSIELPNHIYLFIYLVFFSHGRALSEENGTGVLLKRAWWQTNPKKETLKNTQTADNNDLILPTSIVCEARAGYSLFLCAMGLNCCPKTIKNTLLSHSFAPVNMLLHHRECTRCSLFWMNPTYTVPLPQILTRA